MYFDADCFCINLFRMTGITFLLPVVTSVSNHIVESSLNVYWLDFTLSDTERSDKECKRKKIFLLHALVQIQDL